MKLPLKIDRWRDSKNNASGINLIDANGHNLAIIVPAPDDSHLEDWKRIVAAVNATEERPLFAEPSA